MRTFVRFDSEGTIVAVTRHDSIPDELDQPWQDLATGEEAIEVEATPALDKLSPLEIMNTQRVDVSRQKLVRRRRG